MMGETEASALYADAQPAPRPQVSGPTPEQAQRYLTDAPFHYRVKMVAAIIQEKQRDIRRRDALDLSIICVDFLDNAGKA